RHHQPTRSIRLQPPVIEAAEAAASLVGMCRSGFMSWCAYNVALGILRQHEGYEAKRSKWPHRAEVLATPRAPSRFLPTAARGFLHFRPESKMDIRINTEIELDADQQKAVEMCCDLQKRLVSVSGAAGSGKTTIIRLIHEFFAARHVSVAL